MNNLYFIGTCANGVKVFNRLNSHLHKEVTEEILREALSKFSPTSRFHKDVIDMKRIIGKTNCVPIDENDDIIYVIRKNRNGPTPMVKGKVSIDCSFLTVVLKKIEEGYILISSYIGNESEPEPWDTSFYDHFTWKKKDTINELAYQKSVEFWNTHALVYDKDEVLLFLS